MLRWSLALLATAACARPPAPPCPAVPAAPAAPAATTPAPPPAIGAERQAFWEAARTQATPPPDAAALVPELERMLTSPDPVVRDRLAYEVLARWLGAEGGLPDDAVRGLRDRLVTRTAEPPRVGDEVFARSFAALVLSVIAAREVKAPRWSPAELEAQVAAAVAYAAREQDLRGYTGATGWAHAAAHTADWMKFLARHPALTRAQATALLTGVTALVTRRHGARFAHGEDERLAAAVRAVARRELVDDAGWDAWLTAVLAPLASGWPEPFDLTTFVTQRNARDLVVSSFVALSFDDSPGAARARARVEAAMRAP